MTVRLAKKKDIDELIRLAAQWLSPLYHVEEKRRMLLNELKDKNEKIFIMEHGKSLVGFIDVCIHHDWLTATNKVWLKHCYTDSQYRRKGIASSLIRTVMEKIEWDWFFVDFKTEEAKALYLKMGFKQNNSRDWLEIYRKDLKR